MCSITGVPSTGTIGFGTSYVSGRRRVPRPAASRIARLNSIFAPAVRTAYRRRSGSLIPAREVLRLLGRELVDRDPHRLELQLRDLIVDLLRHHVDLALELGRMLGEV